MAKAAAPRKKAKPADGMGGKGKRSEQPANATVSLPRVPADYGLRGTRFLSWNHAEERLVRSRNYWICTARPDGRPHSIPVWGMWMDGALYFGTGRDTRKAKNLSHNPAVSVHLESGDDVVILEGTVEPVDIGADKPLRKSLDGESRRKYKMPLAVMEGVVLYRLRPRVALAWTEKEFPDNATRWEFTR